MAHPQASRGPESPSNIAAETAGHFLEVRTAQQASANLLRQRGMNLHDREPRDEKDSSRRGEEGIHAWCSDLVVIVLRDGTRIEEVMRHLEPLAPLLDDGLGHRAGDCGESFPDLLNRGNLLPMNLSGTIRDGMNGTKLRINSRLPNSLRQGHVRRLGDNDDGWIAQYGSISSGWLQSKIVKTSISILEQTFRITVNQ